MALDVTTAPTFEPVTLAEAKEAMNLSHGRHDSLITGLIVAARRFVETTLRQTLPTTTYTLYLDRWPSKRRYGESTASHGSILLPMPPAVSVTTVKYIDTDGNTATVSSSDYQVDTDSEPGRVKPAFDKTWPTTRGQFNAVTVQFVGGYATTAKVPDGIKTAIKMAVAHWHENREPVVIGTITAKLPLAVESLLWQHKISEYR